MKTTFTDRIGCRLPVQQAPMPGVSTVDLAAAVANGGGLGMIGAPMVPAADLEAQLDDLASRTDGAWGVNFLMPFLDPECLDVAAKRARLVEFFYGDPDRGLVERAKAHGALASWQIGSIEEARAAEAAGCDLLVVQGTEAGGHVRGEVSLFPLLAKVVAESSLPRLAAGGIATRGDVEAALAAGADGVRVGTRFLASTESGAHPEYVEQVLAARAKDTILTTAYSGMWPDAPHRVLRSAIEAAGKLDDGAIVGEMAMGSQTMPLEKWSVICPSAAATGNVAAMALYAGESVENVNDVKSVDEILKSLFS